MQNLHFARLALARAREVGAAARREALASGVFHLGNAVAAFIGEVLAVSGARLPVLIDTRDWLQQIPEGEAPELQRLQMAQEQWLGELQRAVRALTDVAVPAAGKAIQDSQILAVDVGAGSTTEVSVEQLAAWLAECASLINELREGMAEW